MVVLERGADQEVLYDPNPVMKQFHASTARYTLTHGGRNSGKSWALRWDAHMRNLAISGHRALLLRRTFPQLRGSHFDAADVEAAQLGCKPLHKTNYHIDYANGSKLQFGHCESDSAVYDYLSQTWDWIGFDELTTFTYDQFIKICASARTNKNSGRKAYIRAATNPIGVGATWVRRYFIDKSITEVENPKYRPSDWVDIPANMDDNPFADITEYERDLAMLPSEELRRAYRHGEWLIEGQFFSEFAEKKLVIRDGDQKVVPWHVIPELPTYKGLPLLSQVEVSRAVDWGYTPESPGWCGWFAHMPDGSAILFKEMLLIRKTAKQAAELIAAESRGMKVRFTVGDEVMGWEREGESIQETMRKNGVWVLECDKDRPNGWMRVHSWLKETIDDGRGERPRLQIHQSCEYTIRTLPTLQTNPKKPLDIIEGAGVDDHAADAIRYWAMSRPNPTRMPSKLTNWDHWKKRMKLDNEGDFLGSESVG